MANLRYVKAERIILKDTPEFSEKWVLDKISDDPKILGLGNLLLFQKEKIQPGAGRLDLLLQDENDETRYEVEIQLGKTNESHIIRVLEYWDVEKKRNLNFNHVAVLVAEDITNRFLNVISLFNGAIPLVALQMESYKIEDRMILIFTKVLDQRLIGIEPPPPPPTDRPYWEKRATKKTVELADELMKLVNKLDDTLVLKYNKFYIGLAHDGQPYNFIAFKPQKTVIKVQLKLPESDEITQKFENAGLEILDYSTREGRYSIRLTKENIEIHQELLMEMIKKSYDEFGGDNSD